MPTPRTYISLKKKLQNVQKPHYGVVGKAVVYRSHMGIGSHQATPLGIQLPANVPGKHGRSP